MFVMVCVSTCETPGIALIFSTNSSSGAYPLSGMRIHKVRRKAKNRIAIVVLGKDTYLASHGPKSSSGTVVISLKSKQAPHTKRFTVTPSLTFLISGRYSSTTLAIASRLSDVALSPSYLQRHSRQTRLKDMAPFASGTSANEDAGRPDGIAGAKAWRSKGNNGEFHALRTNS